MKGPKSSRTPKRNSWQRKKPLSIIILTIFLVFGAFYAWEYRPQTLINETTSIKESYVGQFDVDVTFGNRNVKIIVATLAIPVYVTFWWQQGTTTAMIYFGNVLVQVNSTSTTDVSVHNSGGTYFLMVQKSEQVCEPCMTIIHVEVAI